jgi:hypothetical protein
MSLLAMTLSVKADPNPNSITVAPFSDCEKIKEEVKELKKACNGLKGQEKKTCKQENKEKVRAKKDELKKCKNPKKAANKNEKKLKREVRKIVKLSSKLSEAKNEKKRKKIGDKLVKEWKEAEYLCKLVGHAEEGEAKAGKSSADYQCDGEKLKIKLNLFSSEIQKSIKK